MSAIPDDIPAATARLSADVTRPFPNARKIRIAGSRPDIRVPMREVCQTPTVTNDGLEANPPIYVYDTSGPFTDPDVRVDLTQGLPEVRARWIEERGDTEVLPGPSSEYGRRRQADPGLAHLRFAHVRPPRRARAGRNVTQMHYARQGVVTPEMEFVAIRESQRLDALRAVAGAQTPAFERHLGSGGLRAGVDPDERGVDLVRHALELRGAGRQPELDAEHLGSVRGAVEARLPEKSEGRGYPRLRCLP